MFYVVDKKFVDKNTLLQVLDTSDGVAEWYSYEEVKDMMRNLHIPIFGAIPLKVYPPSSGVFNKHVASILLSRFIRYLLSIPSEVTLDSLGFVTETLPNGKYGFDSFEYHGIGTSCYISKDMCTIYARMKIKSSDKIESADLYKSLVFDDKNTIPLEVSVDDVYTRKFTNNDIVKVVNKVVSQHRKEELMTPFRELLLNK